MGPMGRRTEARQDADETSASHERTAPGVRLEAPAPRPPSANPSAPAGSVTPPVLPLDRGARALTIVVPALDEEQALADTLRRCLDARAVLCQKAGLTAVEVVLVNDGSRDGTEQIARGFGEVTVLGFDENQGYGAALKAGFEVARTELVGFLDADGTCDPVFFADLCRACLDEGADVALGSRLGPGSEMPKVRRLGNRLFALMLGVLSGRAVQDTASGMRVIRRDRLPDLDPLPDGLHYTPAMSARILLGDDLRLVERPMPYAERVGRSKLSVVRDGLRFLRVIVEAAVCFRPARPLLLLAGLAGAVSLALGAGPALHYLSEGALEESMIHRILAASLGVTLAAVLVEGAVVAERIAASAHRRPVTGMLGRLEALHGPRMRWVVMGGLAGAALAVSAPGLGEALAGEAVAMHWSRVVLSSLLLVLATVLGVTTFLLGMLRLLRARSMPRPAATPPDRLRPGATAGPRAGAPATAAPDDGSRGAP